MLKRITWLVIIAILLSACQSLEVGVGADRGGTQFTPMQVSAPDCNYGGKLKSIEAVDQDTVRFTLCSPDPAFLYKIAFGAFSIQKKGYLDAAQGDSTRMSMVTNSSGPYRVRQWSRGDQLVLEANPDYWGVPPKSREIVFKWNSDPAVRLNQLQSAAADGIDNLSPNDFTAVQNDSNLKFYTRPAMNVFYLGMNNAIAPFDKEAVRQAFAMAVNRKQLVLKFYPSGSLVADQFVPPTIKPGASDNLPWYDYNPDQALQMLKDAGFDFNQEIELSFFDTTRGYLPDPVGVANAVKDDLARIGVKIRLNQVETAKFINSVAAGERGFFMLGWTGDYPDASNFYEFHFTGASKNFGAPYPDLEKAVIAGGSTADNEERQRYYDEANRLIRTHVPVIPVAHGFSALAFSDSVLNVNIGALNENFEEMSTVANRLVFMQSSEPNSLWPGDETFGDTLRPATLVYDTLLRFEFGGLGVQPSLAESWVTNKDATQWTFYLHRGVKFSDGSILNANDVVATFAAQWDASSPNHKGDTGTFEYFAGFFGEFINKK